MSQQMYEARIIPAGGGAAITVTVHANSQDQAKRIIEQQYGPIRSWNQYPQQVYQR